MKIEMGKCKRRLSKLWFIASGFLFLIILLQTIFEHYGENANEAWEWLLPSVMPTLSLMIGAYVVDIKGKGIAKKRVERYIYRISFMLSAVYLLALMLTILLQPFSSLNLMEQVNHCWLGPFQGIVSASIGMFFFKTEEA